MAVGGALERQGLFSATTGSHIIQYDSYSTNFVPCMYDESLYMSRFSLGLNHYRLRTLHRQPTYKNKGP